jgi:dTDP-4-amino-4,6-dideoxygalactose transaminase
MIPVHLFGMPCDMAALTSIAKHHRLKIITDSCECMLAETNGYPGDIVCYSMYVAHLLTAGVGGIAITNNRAYATVMRSLVNHGRDGIYISIDDDDGLTSVELREVISRRFNFEWVGHSYRITELEAALALAQLDDLQGMIDIRRKNAERLTANLSDLEDMIQLPTIRPMTQHSFMMYPIVLWHEIKENLVAFLEEHGIETRDMLPLTDQLCYEGMWNPADYPVAEWINASGFYLGVHHALEYKDMDYVSDILHDYFQVTP